jgi:hypothetical protein
VSCFRVNDFAGSLQERDFPISRNPGEERRRVVGTHSLDPWECFYKGGGHLAALELRGGQHKDFYVRRGECRSLSDSISDAIILG